MFSARVATRSLKTKRRKSVSANSEWVKDNYGLLIEGISCFEGEGGYTLLKAYKKHTERPF